MEAHHTEGPWKFYTQPQPNGCPIVGTHRGLMIAMLAHSVKEPLQAETALANARLIAAAPDMLEALINALALIELVMPVEGDVTRKVRRAIAKATQ